MSDECAKPDEPASHQSPATAAFCPDETAGMKIGPYKLLQRMGEGGMGAVWMAEQTEPVQRRVALKIIKAGLGGEHVLARFEAERQALAMMDHPNIAKVLDAGATSAGRPYFVMELVKGIPFTKYCDQEHLTPAERLALFIPVCNAVQHAHQKGIIHRDLKPSNVLIALYDGKPVPKVIDFGVAKATQQKLTEHTMFTQVGQIIGTLEYMAPEQAELNNLDVDTRADIYSLGVMLYELLTGSLPFTGKQLRAVALGEMLRLIREVEPPRPSTKLSSSEDLPAIAAKRKLEPKKLARLVRGDLDWIVMKCLEKDRGRRYETANQLGQELQRYLSDEPVQAGPPSAGYRLKKFLRRNKGPAIAGALVLFVLIAGMIGTSIGLVEAELARQAAEANETKANAATEAEKLATKNATDVAEANKLLAKEADDGRKDAETGRKQAENFSKKADAEKLIAEAERKRAEKESQLARDNEQKALQNLYISQMNQAWRAWKDCDVWHVLQLLNATDPAHTKKPDFRGFEWHYLNRLCRATSQTLRGRPFPFRDVSFHPDGNRLVSAAIGYGDQSGPPTAAKSGQIEVWDVAKGKISWNLEIPKEIPNYDLEQFRAAYTSDGKYLITANGAKVQIRDGANGKQLASLPGQAFAIAKDGKRVATTLEDRKKNEYRVFVFECPSGKEITNFKGHNAFISTLAFSPDGQRLVVGGIDGRNPIPIIGDFMDGPSGRLLDVQTGKELFLFRHPYRVNSVAFSHDGTRVATAGNDETVRVWNAETGKEVFKLVGHTQPVSSVAFSQDDKRLGSGAYDETVRLWDLRTGKEVMAFRGHTAGVTGVAFAPDGYRLASASADGTIKIWDTRQEQESLIIPIGFESITRISFHPDGPRLAGVGPGVGVARDLMIWDIDNGKISQTIRPSFLEVVASPVAYIGDGKRLAYGVHSFWKEERTIIIREVASRKQVAVIPCPEFLNHMAVSSDGHFLAFSTKAGLEIWNVNTGKKEKSFEGGKDMPNSQPVFSPDGKYLSLQGKVWNLLTGKEIHSFPGAFNVTGFSHDSQRFIGVGHADLYIWDMVSGRQDFARPLTRNGLAALSRDGKRLATHGSDGTVNLWDISTGQVVLSFKTHCKLAWDLAFSADGTRLAISGGRDGITSNLIQIWNATPLKEPEQNAVNDKK